VGGRCFCKELHLQGKGVKLQGKEYSRKGPTIRIRVNLQGMDLSRKSRSGIRKEQYLQGMDFARNANTSSSVSDNVSFVAVQSSVYKSRRKGLRALPIHGEGVPEAVAVNAYATLNGSVCFCGSVEADGSAIMFASDEQLQLLATATTVFIDATFKTVPRLYCQLFTVFIQQDDVFLFPVCVDLSPLC